MDRFYSNITGCIRYADYLDAAKWLDKAKAQPDDESYLILLRKVFDKYPLMANSEHFAHFKISDNLYISKDERILQVSELLNTDNYEDELDREFIKKRENSHEVTIDIKDL
ncbi:hypothetical protein [Shewanella ulleungensis]|uniref:hypothetical protein n=1 Tax=Shewanella ulleungensis TaxID=2282699 RepID=UPI003D7BBDD1